MLGKLTTKTNTSQREETIKFAAPKAPTKSRLWGSFDLDYQTTNYSTVHYQEKTPKKIFSKIHHRFTNQSFNGWREMTR